jgi:hypothetical protein
LWNDILRTVSLIYHPFCNLRTGRSIIMCVFLWWLRGGGRLNDSHFLGLYIVLVMNSWYEYLMCAHNFNIWLHFEMPQKSRLSWQYLFYVNISFTDNSTFLVIAHCTQVTFCVKILWSFYHISPAGRFASHLWNKILYHTHLHLTFRNLMLLKSSL